MLVSVSGLIQAYVFIHYLVKIQLYQRPIPHVTYLTELTEICSLKVCVH